MVKTSLVSVLKIPEKQAVISQAAATVSRIIIRSLLFLRLYLMHHKDTPSVVNAELVDTMFKTVCQRNVRCRPRSVTAKVLRDKLSVFYKQHFEPLLPIGDESLPCTHLNTVLAYTSMQVVTVFETNIKQYFVEYVEAYVNTVWQKDYLIKCIKATRRTKRGREAAIRKLCVTLWRLKNDLSNVDSEPFQSHPPYHLWMRQQKSLVLPPKTRYEKDLLYYDLKCKPQDYWPGMLRMTEMIEQAGKKVRNFCPLRTIAIPRHITLDTTTLIHLLFTKENGTKSKLLTEGELMRKKKKIWKTFFRTNMKVFKARDYLFNHMISTDRAACSILLVRCDLYDMNSSQEKLVVA